jgi:hypothetical protein
VEYKLMVSKLVDVDGRLDWALIHEEPVDFASRKECVCEFRTSKGDLDHFPPLRTTMPSGDGGSCSHDAVLRPPDAQAALVRAGNGGASASASTPLRPPATHVATPGAWSRGR